MPVMRKGETAVNGNGNITGVIGAIAPEPKIMTIASIKQSAPGLSEMIVIYGPEGVGKTTFAAGAPSPIFIPVEEGLRNVKVDTFPAPTEWQHIFDAIETLRLEPHQYKTLVIDTVDAAERLCQSHLLKRDKKMSIEDYGYGKGYVLSFEEFKRLLSPIEHLRKEKNMNVIFLAHSAIRTFNSPITENWDRWELKLDRRIASLLKESSDILLFMGYNVVVDVKTGQAKGKAYGGDRVIYTTHAPAYDAKNRHNMPAQITMDAAQFWTLVQGGAK